VTQPASSVGNRPRDDTPEVTAAPDTTDDDAL
jgi:hypothetical protein